MIPLLIQLFTKPVQALPISAGTALRQGNCATAVLELPNPTEWYEQLAIGRCYVSLGKIDAAELTLSEVSGEWAPMALLYRSQAASLGGDSYQALVLANRVLDTANISDAIRTQATLEKARALIATEQYIDARDFLRPLLTPKNTVDGYRPHQNEIDPAEVRWLLAEGARLRGSTTASIPVYWKIWTANPTSTFSTLAEERLTTLGQRIPDSTTDDGRKKMVQRANTLRKMQMHKEALELLDQLPVPESELEKKTYAYYVFSAKDYTRAVSLLSELSNPTDKEIYHLAVASVRSGDYDSSIAYYRQLLTEFPTSRWADIASYKIAYSEYDRGNLEIALPLFKEHIERMPKSKYLEESKYWIAWAEFKLGNLEVSKQAFANFQKEHFRSSLAAGAAFWHAFIQRELGDLEGANKGFDYVLRTWPDSGYAWQATLFVPAHFPVQPIVDIDTLDLPKVLDTQNFHDGRALASVGFEEQAQEKLQPLKSVVSGNRQATLMLAHALIEAGDYRGAQRLAKPHCTKSWKGGDPLAQQACFPKPHREIIEATIGDHDLDPNLPYAIMTAESALQPTVSSPAGARGMMQLMPFVAERLHPSIFPNQPFNADDLFLSGYNVSLGTKELMTLLDHLGELPLQHPLPLVIAGYNGGEEAVQRWMSLYDVPPEVAEFSDDIGYTETRRYNRRVLGYLMTYRYVYGFEPVVDESHKNQ
jgi:soluble lytic murein transglycosylase-like protein/TolA-binding protein